MRRKIIVSLIMGLMFVSYGCGSTQDQKEADTTVSFEEIVPKGEEPIILRNEQDQETSVSEQVQEEASQEETQTQEVTAYTDLKQVAYEIESAQYEEGVVTITYPKIVQMENLELQAIINTKILESVKKGSDEEGYSSYELSYEVASKGSGILSLVFKGMRNSPQSAYPVNLVKTLNIDMTSGENIRLKDYADIAQIVSGLETSTGYEILSQGVDMQDFGAFLNNGYVTDYAITLLDYDSDFQNMNMIPAGYSCIRDNKIVLFIEAEHAMGDYVELVFLAPLTQ